MSHLKTNYRAAAGLGFVSIFSYLASYYARNLLSVATPSMLADGAYTSDYIGLFSSAYFLTYALGQLVNGFVGESVHPRYMIFGGLSLAGVSIMLFPFLLSTWAQVVCFMLMGFGLSMLRGPIMKMVSENLDTNLARTVCTFLTVATFAGPFIASMFAIVFKWKSMFVFAGGLTIGIAIVTFGLLVAFEKKGVYSFQRRNANRFSDGLELFRLDGFVFYIIVGGVTEIAQSAITFWIPTYLSEALGFDSVASNVLFSVITAASAVAPFLALLIFHRIGECDAVMLRVGFFIAVASFVGMILIPNVWIKPALLVLAKLSLACCSSVLWSIYVPSMGYTGKVSSVNGVIDCTGYLAAAAANAVFARMIGMSWSGVIAVWCGISLLGLIASFIKKQKRGTENGQN